MSLIEKFKEPCTLMERHRVPDGEGGWMDSWLEGMSFSAAIVLDNSSPARMASKDAVSTKYTVTVDKAYRLEFHGVFKRDSDGQAFRVLSNSDDVQTPEVASFSFQQVQAEEYHL